ncbi:hypothetical protein [Seonamhaeicola marinus]|uniref:Uncharacterized protein n=1 Tax=Seonamhaeicola marinus TaxID=1912246 RepID=A0A5D0HJH4_9FLAO|nr:hypothetical protein [Seonamhaeicola marinus]TYA71385.1 hypothetical protein FUA24_17530 [Seonamhaeicola marinus]
MKTTLSILSISILLFSCSSNQSSDNANDTNFYALTVGNSWVYKNYKLNETNVTYEETSVVDSISVVSKQTIKGETFYKVRRFTSGNEANITFCNPNGEHFQFLRDSLGYLINSDGEIKHTYVNYEERLVQENNWGNIYEVLENGTEEINVESGKFNCISSKRYAKDPDNQLLPAEDKYYYADGYGLIYDTQSFVSSDKPSIIRRLDAYNIN